MKIVLFYFTIAFLVFLFVMVVLGFVHQFFKKTTWFCSFMGWHLEPENKGFNGCSMNGVCPRCGNKVLLDSQGNWF
jgi:hypothetical protein